MGNAFNKIDKWTFIQIFDLTNILNEINSLQIKTKQIREALKNKRLNEYYKKEIENTCAIIDILEHKVSSQSKQLNPLMKVRSKRGLINGLGSIIKVITGNLDYSDAEKFDKAIDTLSDNQVKIKTLVNEQITLLQKSIKAFNESTQILANNQEVLKSRILQIENILKNIDTRNIETYQFFLIQTTFSQIITAFKIIYDVLERIEVAITFSKINVLHNSIIEPNELLLEIKTIEKHIQGNKLPFEPTLDNILYFEKTIEIKSFSKDNKIMFVLEIPIVEKWNYNYYHLFPLPTRKGKLFRAILPKAKYLILNENEYSLFDTKCEDISKETFMCYEANPVKINTEAPCEIHMLKFTMNTTTCQGYTVEIKQTKIQKLEQNKWAIIAPETAVAVQKCDSDEENIPLQGTYVLELNSRCTVKIGETDLKTYQDFNTVYRNIELPNLDLMNNEIMDSNISFNVLKLDAINLDDIKYVNHALDIEKEYVHNISKDYTNPFHVNAWIIIIYVILIILFLYFLYRIVSNKYKTRSVQQKADQGLDHAENPVKFADMTTSPRISL